MKYISNMNRCMPASALSNVKEKNHWTLIPYDTEEISGVMVGASSTANAPDVTLPLGITGWHAVSLGFWNPHHDYDGDTTVKLKLTGDPCFQPISDFANAGLSAAPINWTGAELQECFFRCADLTGQDIIIGQQKKGVPKKSYIAYFKLTPLCQEAVDAIRNDRVRTDTRILIAANDGGSFLCSKGCTTKEELLEQFELYRHSDIGKVIWAFTYGDVTNYPSEVGHLVTTGKIGNDIPVPVEYKIWYESLHPLISKGLIPAQVALEHIHNMGLKFDAMFRMGILGANVPPGDIFPGVGLIKSNPRLRMLAKDGTPLEKASYAFPEVQEFMLSLIREVAENFDIDGVNLGWVRGPQFVGYEPPVIEDFKKEYGEDPRDLDDNEIRVQRFRAVYLTEFTRKVRRLLNDEGKKRGRKIELSAWVYPAETNLFYGLDVVTWLEEGLLDSIIGAVSKEFVEAAKVHNCRFYHGDRGIEGVLKGYENGVDGFAFWDINLGVYCQELPESWAVTARMGHREEVEAFAKEPPKMKRIKLKTVGGYDICHTINRGANERNNWPPEMLPFYSGG